MAGNPRQPEHDERPIEEFIGEVQYAIRGAAHIYARQHGVRGILTVAGGDNADFMLEQIVDLIAYAGELSPDPNWSQYLNGVGGRLDRLTPMERRGHVHNALTGLKSGQVLPIEQASRGALRPYAMRGTGQCWMEFDPSVDQWPQPAAGAEAAVGRRAIAQSAEPDPAPAADVSQTGAFIIAGNSLHWWEHDDRP